MSKCVNFGYCDKQFCQGCQSRDISQKYLPNRKGFERFLAVTNQTAKDGDGFYEQWLVDNFSNLDCDLITYTKRLETTE